MAIEYFGQTDDGSVLGRSVAEGGKVAFYGSAPVVQRSSTVLATSLLSASSYVTVAANLTAIILELSNVLTNVKLIRTTA
jgi:hypothetical protein